MGAIIAPRFKWMQRLAHESYTPSTDVPSLVNWYRADTVTIATGVSQLTDKKGSVNPTQATGSKQPTQNVADSLMGGRDSITFDGTQHALIAASPGIGSMSAITIFLVVRSVATPAATAYLLGFGSTSTAQSVQVICYSTTGNTRAQYANPGGTASSWQHTPAQSDASAARPCILAYSGTLANGGSTVWEGRGRLGSTGGAVTNASTGSTLANQIFCMGANTTGGAAFASFTFGELMICNAALTTEQMRRVELYLAGYYGLL